MLPAVGLRGRSGGCSPWWPRRLTVGVSFIVLFDRSWYNRAGVETVMGFCTPQEHALFLRQTPIFEQMLVTTAAAQALQGAVEIAGGLLRPAAASSLTGPVTKHAALRHRRGVPRRRGTGVRPVRGHRQ
jgi:hypothetical protein